MKRIDSRMAIYLQWLWRENEVVVFGAEESRILVVLRCQMNIQC